MVINKVAVVTGADRGLGYALCEELLLEGWQVFAGQFIPEWTELKDLAYNNPELLKIISLNVASLDSINTAVRTIGEITDHVDMLINNAGINVSDGDIRNGMDFTKTQDIFNVNTLGPIRMVQAFLPIMGSGMKRLCFVSSEAGSISLCNRNSNFGYCMSKTALNMAIKIMFNDLYKDVFTFRIYHPGWLRSYMSGQKSTTGVIEPEESAKAAVPFFIKNNSSEDTLVMVDNKGEEWPF
ncbi:MAG: SDR family NAD(P)-dependent oxidoreductase [Clostridiaceae bacterium]|nr:SDR family NAD(P)-dependent oxidoreductase [Clostridiaceae bacterium]